MVLGLEPDFHVVGEAADFDQTLRQARALRPDVVLLDLKMPKMYGLNSLRALRAATPSSRILILTGAGVDETAIDLLEGGADGYVLKDIEPAELARAIRVVAQGYAYVDPQVARLLVNRARRGGRLELAQAYGLTARELDVLRGMATSATYEEIGRRLGISEGTVRTHAKHILAKLGQPNRAQAVLVAIRLGLIPPEPLQD